MTFISIQFCGMRHVISPEFEQQWLLPARIEDWVGADHEALDRHRHKMRQPEAQALLKMRSEIVEPVFAQIKQNGGFRRWTLGGLENVRTQWAMICTAWNLKKLFAGWREALTLLPA